MATVAQIINEFCYRGLYPTSSAYVTSTDSKDRQYVSLLKYVCETLLAMPLNWPQLKRNYLFLTQTNVRDYPLPGDFYRPVESTPWDAYNQWPMRGPISDYNYAIRSLAVVSLQTRKAFQVTGKPNVIFHGRNPNEYNSSVDSYFQIDPAGESESDLLSLMYISQNWALPAAWNYGTAYSTAGPSVVNVNGNIYTCTTSGTSASRPTPPPNVVNGIGQDGNSMWANIIFSNWAATTVYSQGQYVKTSASRYYICVTGGTSGASDPTSEDNPVTDGTVTWNFIETSAWAAVTAYEYGDFVTSNSQLFMNISRVSDGSTSVSGAYAPNWSYTSNSWRQVDGTVTWSWNQGVYTIATDNDLILFDKDTVVDGMDWAFLRSKGLEYADKKASWESDIRSAFARFNGPMRINAADEFGDQFGAWPNTPSGSWDV